MFLTIIFYDSTKSVKVGEGEAVDGEEAEEEMDLAGEADLAVGGREGAVGDGAAIGIDPVALTGLEEQV